MTTYSPDLPTMGLGLLLARVVIGPLMAAHGAQKLLGWFGGYGLKATGELMGQLGFQPGRAFAAAASVSEIGAGLLITLGFLGPIGPALMLSVMIVAAITVHLKNGVFAMQNGIELPLLYGVAGFGLAMTGFGAYSLDAWLDIAGRVPVAANWIALVAGTAGAVVNLALRRRPAGEVRA